MIDMIRRRSHKGEWGEKEEEEEEEWKWHKDRERERDGKEEAL